VTSAVIEKVSANVIELWTQLGVVVRRQEDWQKPEAQKLFGEILESSILVTEATLRALEMRLSGHTQDKVVRDEICHIIDTNEEVRSALLLPALAYKTAREGQFCQQPKEGVWSRPNQASEQENSVVSEWWKDRFNEYCNRLSHYVPYCTTSDIRLAQWT
jgi:hypothetical protein